MLIRSIRWRLQAWHGGLLLLVLIGFGWTAFLLEQDRQLRLLDEELRRRAAALILAQRAPHPVSHSPSPGQAARAPRDAHGPPPPRLPPNRPLERAALPAEPVRLPEHVLRLFDAGDTNGFYYVFWSLDRQELARSGNAPPGLTAPTRNHLPESSPPRTRGIYREVVMATPRAISLVGRSMASDLREMRKTGWRMAGAGGVIWLFGLAGGWWLVTRAMAPIHAMSQAAGKISEGDLSQRIKIEDTENELGRLAGVLNSTFARLEAAFAQQGRFTSDAAHELRTPLTILLTQIQTALARPRETAEYRDYLQTCLRAVQRMRRLVESLLELARFDSGQETLQRVSFRADQAIEESIDLLRPLATQRGVGIEYDLPEWTMEGDKDRLTQVMTNLIGNAIEYNRQGGQVRISARPQDGYLNIVVQDTGPGIAPEHLPRLFDRFYRIEASRSGSRDHAGLGLAIAKAIAEAQGGRLEVNSEVGVGSAFTLRLPGACLVWSKCSTPVG